ncbi:putative F-box protein [Cardamine amara subsp. amara]|uniref:F-box protein n=1 Tax=Cardamine amara subsp. amara TaxID=228776 RepID=A0ABD0Z4W5_CARAN
MPNLEQLILYNIPTDEDVIKFSSQLQMLPKVASPKCKIQVVSDNLSLTSTLSTKWGPPLYKINSDLSPATSFSSW